MDKGKCFREKFSLKQSLKQKVFTLLAWQTPLLLCPNDYCLLPSKWIFFFCYFITSPSIYISCLLVHTLLYNNEQQKDSTERTAHHLQILYFDLIVVDSMYGKKNAYGRRVVKQKVADTCLPSIFFSLKQNLGFFGRPVSARIYCRYTDPLFQGWTLIVYPTLLAAVIVSEAVI